MKTADVYKLVICKEFSPSPGPRYASEGDFSGEEFRIKLLAPRLKDAISNKKTLFIDLDGTAGYGTSFLEEAFGGLIRIDKYKYDDILAHLQLKSEEEPYLTEDIMGYLKDAHVAFCNEK